jgi:hypothetical protein
MIRDFTIKRSFLIPYRKSIKKKFIPEFMGVGSQKKVSTTMHLLKMTCFSMILEILSIGN